MEALPAVGQPASTASTTTSPTAAPASFATSSPLDELFAASASASAIQLSTSFTAAQLSASEPIGVPDQSVLLQDPREHGERRDRDRRADEEHERQPVDRRAVDDVVFGEEPEGHREAGEERHAEDRRGHRREVVRPRQVRAVELRAERERERHEADRAEVAHDPHRVLGEQPRPRGRGPAEHRRPDHDAGEQLADHGGLAEAAADDAAEVGDGE